MSMPQDQDVRAQRVYIASQDQMVGVEYTGNGAMAVPLSMLGTGTPRKSNTLNLQVTVVTNGYIVGKTGGPDQFICATMDDVKDRVIALLAAHHMDMQK